MFWEYDDEKLREECGVFGIFGHPEAAILTALGLHALQHRGQEACGIATFDKTGFHVEKHMGLVGDGFTGSDMHKRLPGHAAIGHNRYSTQGKSGARNIQPIFADIAGGGCAVAHNGNLTNARKLRYDLVQSGSIFHTTMDSEIMLPLISRSAERGFTNKLIDALGEVEGGYAMVLLTGKKLIGARDPVGLRPLVLGRLGNSYVLASETCAFDIIGAEFVREIENGEIVVITEDGIESITPFAPRPARPCVFEYVYFSRPDSIVQGRSVYQVRRNMGRHLAEESAIDADVVVPVPDGGIPAAIGYSLATGVPFEQGIIRSHYIGRTFIQPTQTHRTQSVSRKHAANRAVLEGKRVVLIDDSIVRGTTSEKIVDMVRDAGAKEIHFRSASPPIKYPDFYGIDMPSKEELLASRMDIESMARKLGVDSLAYLSVDGLYKAIQGKERDNSAPAYADHCFTGEYPTPLTDHGSSESSKDYQLSLLLD